MATSPRKFDLTFNFASCLDRHLVLPMLEFLQTKGLYSENEILQAKLELLAKTNMVDLAIEIWQTLHASQTPPEEMKVRREEVINHLFSVQQQCGPVLRLFVAQEDQESIADVMIREKVCWISFLFLFFVFLHFLTYFSHSTHSLSLFYLFLFCFISHHSN
jgi:hypothetical protein